MISTVAWSPDGRKVAIGTYWDVNDDIYGGDVTVLSSDGEELWSSGNLGDYVYSVAWSPDGEKLVVGGAFDKIIVFDETGGIMWSQDLGGAVEDIFWDPNRREIVVITSSSKVITYYAP